KTGGGSSFYFDNRTGFSGGAYFIYRINKFLSLQPEFFYTARGFKVYYYIRQSGVDNSGKEYNSIYDTRRTIRMNYLELPMLLKVSIPIKRIQPYVLGGPVLAVNVS